MERSDAPLILASASPRRRELMERFGVPFEILPAPGPETAPAGLSPRELVIALAGHKAAEIAALRPEAVVVAADTVVEIGGEILGKPGTPDRAAAMLRRLSGETNRVWTGLCVRRGGEVLSAAECTEVRFRPLDDAEIEAYVRTGEPLDKAGAYGYQGLACLFVEEIRGDYFNVVGLPLCRLGQMLRSFGVELLNVRPSDPVSGQSEDML